MTTFPNCDDLIVKIAETMAVYIDVFNELDGTHNNLNKQDRDAAEQVMSYLEEGIGRLDAAIMCLPASDYKALTIQLRSLGPDFSHEKSCRGSSFRYILEQMEKKAGIDRSEYGGIYWAGRKKSFQSLIKGAAA